MIEVEITSHTMMFESRQAELVLANDITERKRAEANLCRTQESLELALAAAEVGTWEVDLTSPERSLTWSESYGRLFGLTRGEFPGDEAQFFEYIHPDDRELIRQRFGHAIRENVRYECEYRTPWPNGEIHWHLALGHALRDNAGRPVRMLGVGRDITDRKRFEERTQVQLRQMETLHEIDVSIANSLEMTLTLSILV